MAEEGPISSGRQAESQGLAGLFAAPRDIMTPGTFEAALHRAQTEQRWLVCLPWSCSLGYNFLQRSATNAHVCDALHAMNEISINGRLQVCDEGGWL